MADKEKPKAEAKKAEEVKKVVKAKLDTKKDEATKVGAPADTKKAETTDKKDDKKEEKKPEPKLEKKFEATANGSGLPLSLKHSRYICAMIKGKSIDKAMAELEQVTKLKKIVPFKGEVPHKPGKGMMSGRYPIKASTHFIALLKGLKGNAAQNQMDLDKTKITIASPSWARRPMRKGNRHGKRVNVIMKAVEVGSPQGEVSQSLDEKAHSKSESDSKKVKETKKEMKKDSKTTGVKK